MSKKPFSWAPSTRVPLPTLKATKRARYKVGQALVTTQPVPGRLIPVGTAVIVVEAYSARGEGTRYLVERDSDDRFYVYEDGVEDSAAKEIDE